jgi:hypothetical protein
MNSGCGTNLSQKIVDGANEQPDYIRRLWAPQAQQFRRSSIRR